MRKPTVRIATVLLALALIAACAGCGDKSPEAPPSDLSPSPSPSPSDSPSPALSSSPTPMGTGAGMLELGQFYYHYGDPNSTGCMFLEDGTIVDNMGEDGTYVLDWDIISVYFGGELVMEFRIVDEYMLEDLDSFTVYIREGGEGFGSTSVSGSNYLFFIGYYYYLGGVKGSVSLMFWDNGYVDIEEQDLYAFGSFTVASNEITISVEGEYLMTLRILNHAELEDAATGERYALDGTYDDELVTGDYYYFIILGEANGSLCFWDDGFVDMELVNGDVVEIVYALDGDTIYIDYEGEDIILTIVNGYVLDNDGYHYVRLP